MKQSAPPDSALAGISASIGDDQPIYRAASRAGGFVMQNPAQGIEAVLDKEGVQFTAGNNSWAIGLKAFGRDDLMLHVDPAIPAGVGNRVEYQRDGMTEWYANGPLGIEQGFTITRPPAGSKNGKNHPLTLAFRISGDFTAVVDSSGKTLILRKDHADVLRYAAVAATDARGHDQRAWLELAGSELSVRVDDANAEYPLTIDPMVQRVELTSNLYPCAIGGNCITGQAGDLFGNSVAISSDGSTIIVGATGNSGAAYVFVRPKYGWGSCFAVYCYNYAAKLTPSDASSAVGFGYTVAASSNGGIVVVGAPPELRGDYTDWGGAYVYVKPSTGWASATQTAKLTNTCNFCNNEGSFGMSVAISGDGATIAVGVPYQATWDPTTYVTYYDEGAVYEYFEPAGGWVNSTQTRTTPGQQYVSGYYGLSVALSADGSTMAVGESGSASVLARLPYSGSPDYYSPVAGLTASDKGSGFGSSISISSNGGTVAVGAPYATIGGSVNQGAAYVFVKPLAGWANSTETAELTASDGQSQAQPELGYSVSISADGSTVAAGAVRSGRVYLYAKSASGWAPGTESSQITPSNGTSGDQFGISTSLTSDGTGMVAGAPDMTVGNNATQGAAYIFTGYAGTPVGSISPANLGFGNQAVGTTSNSQQVTVTNTGSAPLHITGVSTNAPFATTTNCLTAGTIAIGGSCSEQVTFAPSSVSSFTGALTFTDDSGGTAGTTQQVPLSGTGIKANTSIALMVSPSSVLRGNLSTFSFTVIPPAGETLTPSGTVTVTASTGEQCSASAPSGSCSVTFATAGSRTVTAVYGGDANFNGSTSAATAFQVVDFNVTVQPSSQSIIGGKSGTYTVTASAINGFTGTVTMSCSGAPSGTTCSMSPGQLNLAGNALTSTATVNVSKTATKGNYVLTFTGSYGGSYGTGSRTATAVLTIK